MRKMYSLEQLKNIADQRVTALVEGGTLNNAKPIYCHPITFTHNDSNNAQVTTCTCLIFNNDSTSFTKATFITWLRNLYTQVGGTLRIMLSGAYKDELNNKQAISAYLGIASGTNKIFITGNYTDGSGEYNRAFDDDASFSNYLSSFNDGVNKIN